MDKKCAYCGKPFDDTLKNCPNCGAPNDNIARESNEEPTTIEELKQWYKKHNLPPEDVTRFFIGKNVKEKRAFGIYQDENTGNFVVYKNKNNGNRAVHYEGKDEKYAVNEIYQKLKSEISNQKARNKQNKRNTPPPMKESFGKRFLKKLLKIAGICAIIVIVFAIIAATDHSGYYSYNGTQYYNYDNTWYYYNTTVNTWEEADDLDDEFVDNYKDYYQSYDYDSEYGTSDFDNSYYYIQDHNSSSSSDDDDWGSDWDNDSSWDSSDSWDSGSTDWDSDW